MDSLDAALDAALAMTFPASDPVALFRPDSGRGAVVPERVGPQFGRGASSLWQIGQPTERVANPFGLLRTK
jgi:hypothetical protein